MTDTVDKVGDEPDEASDWSLLTLTFSPRALGLAAPVVRLYSPQAFAELTVTPRTREARLWVDARCGLRAS
jgi:hypothetical protein